MGSTHHIPLLSLSVMHKVLRLHVRWVAYNSAIQSLVFEPVKEHKLNTGGSHL